MNGGQKSSKRQRSLWIPLKLKNDRFSGIPSRMRFRNTADRCQHNHSTESLYQLTRNYRFFTAYLLRGTQILYLSENRTWPRSKFLYPQFT